LLFEDGSIEERIAIKLSLLEGDLGLKRCILEDRIAGEVDTRK